MGAVPSLKDEKINFLADPDCDIRAHSDIWRSGSEWLKGA
jgi:hypothetical protein